MKLGSRLTLALVALLAAVSLVDAQRGRRSSSGSGSRSSSSSSKMHVPEFKPTTQMKLELSKEILSRSSTSFEMLRRAETHRILSEAERVVIGKQAVQNLAVRLEKGDTAKTLRDLRNAQHGELPAEVQARLEKLTQTAERRWLSEGIDAVRLSVERGEWREVQRTSEKWAEEVRKEEVKQRGEMLTLLGEVREASEKLVVLERVDAVLRGKENPRELTSVVSKSLEKPMVTLAALAEVRRLAGSKWVKMPNVVEIKAQVAKLEQGLKGDAAIGQRLLQEFAIKAVLDGHPAEYFKLMPEGGSSQQAAALLRDMKALALGEGKVESQPGKSALPEPGTSPMSARAPPGVEPLIPVGERAGWRPPVVERATSDLPPIEKAVELAAEVKQQAEAVMKPERVALEGRMEQARQKLVTLQTKVLAPEQAERRTMAAIEAELDRRLVAEERVRVRELIEQKQTVKQMAQNLGAGVAVDEDEEYLTAVAAHLGRVLTDEEKAQARRLRKQGRSSAEVAAILL